MPGEVLVGTNVVVAYAYDPRDSNKQAHHGVGATHLRVHLDEFAFRFNCRRTPTAALQTLLGLATLHGPTTYHRLYDSEPR